MQLIKILSRFNKKTATVIPQKAVACFHKSSLKLLSGAMVSISDFDSDDIGSSPVSITKYRHECTNENAISKYM